MARNGFLPTSWWQVTSPDGKLWCETSDEQEARKSVANCPGGGTLQRLYELTQHEWRDEVL